MKTIAESLSIHGLSRIASGSFKQKIFWLISLSAALGVVSYASYGFVQEYLKFDIRTEIRIYDKKSIPLPDIVVCDWLSLGATAELSREYMDLVSSAKTTKTFNAGFIPNGKHDEVPEIPDLDKRINEDIDYPDKCLRVNMSGVDTKIGLAIFNIEQSHDSKYNLYFFHQSEKSIWAKTNSHTSALKPGLYEVLVTDHTVIHRCSKPYPSNCTNGEAMDKVFPGNYTKAKCEDTFRFKSMLQKCGDVILPWRQFLKPWHKNRRNISLTKDELEECLLGEFFDDNIDTPYPCPLPCYEVTYKTQTFHLADDSTGLLQLNIRYATNRVTVIQEVPSYTVDKLLSDIGGWLGLFVGMSLLSLVEIGEFLATAAREYICVIKGR